MTKKSEQPVAKTKSQNEANSVAKSKKLKLVRDSFAIPEEEYAAIDELKARCLAVGVAAKKSEILRAAIKCLAAMSDARVVKALGQLESIKTGRPAKAKK